MIFHDNEDESLISACISRFIRAEDVHVLSLGCGDCSIEFDLLKKYKQLKFVCIDVIEDLKIQNDNITYICKNVDDLNMGDFNIKFDLIYSFSLFQYLKEKDINILNKKLLHILNKNGKIINFDIPNKNKKFLYRINSMIDMRSFDIRYLFGEKDFIDNFSNWINIKKIRFLPNSHVKFISSRIHFERVDQVITKNE